MVLLYINIGRGQLKNERVSLHYKMHCLPFNFLIDKKS